MARFELLSREHDRQSFDCGVNELNEFLRNTARQHQDKGVSKTFVLVDEDLATPDRILGFYSLSACEARTDELPPDLAKRLPRTIPAVLLGRLAVDGMAQGRGYGGALLVDAIRRAAATSAQIGVAGLFVDAKDDRAANFYRKYGFAALPSNPLRLFLPLKTLLQLANG